MNPTLSALAQAGIVSQEDASRIERQLDPEAARVWAETEMTTNTFAALHAQEERLLRVIDQADMEPTKAQMDKAWAAEDKLLFADMRPTLESVALQQATAKAVAQGMAGSFNLINQDVIVWVNDYYMSTNPTFVGSIPNLNVTSRRQLGLMFEQWQQGRLHGIVGPRGGKREGLPRLIRALEPTYGKVRARRVAITETTRIYSEAELRVTRFNPNIELILWQTGNEEHVCAVCGPRHLQTVGKFSNGFATLEDNFFGYPPAHVNCRCAIRGMTQAALDMSQGMFARSTRAPEPDFLDLDTATVDDLMAIGEFELWANQRWPNIQFDFFGMDIEAIRPTLRQFEKLAAQYPEVVARLNYVGGYENYVGWHHDFSNAVAHATQDGKIIAFNPTYYNDAAALLRMEQDCFKSGWTDMDGSIEGIMTHEFGHQVENWLMASRKAFAPYAHADGLGEVSGTVNLFNKKFSPTDKLSRYAVTTNAGGTAHPISAANKVEGWAEGFGAIHHKDKKEWTVWVKRLDRLIKTVGDTSTWDDARYLSMLQPGGQQRAEAVEILTKLRKRLELE